MTPPLSARLRHAWCALGVVLLLTSLAGQEPAKSPPPGYDLDTKALLLARTYLEGGEGASAAVLEALQLMGWGVRDAKGALIKAAPAGTDTGLALRDYELAELLWKPSEQPSLRLISFAQALAVPFQDVDPEELAQDIVACIRKSAESEKPQQRFWAHFIAALGRVGPADYDLTKSAPPAFIPPDLKRIERLASEGIANLVQDPMRLVKMMKGTPLWAEDDPVLAPSPLPKRADDKRTTSAERDQERTNQISEEMLRLTDELASGNPGPDRMKATQEKLEKLRIESMAIAQRMQAAMMRQTNIGIAKVDRGETVEADPDRFLAEWRDQPLCLLQVVLITRVLAADIRKAIAKTDPRKVDARRLPKRSAFGAIRVAQTPPGPSPSFGTQVSGALGDIWATGMGGFTDLVLDHHLPDNNFSKGIGAINAMLAWVKTILSITRQKITLEVENSPLIRTKNRSPGQQRTAKATVEIDFPSSDTLKAVRAALNVTSFDFQLPDGGPVSGAKVVWRLLEGGENTKYQTANGGSAYKPELACVQFAEAGSNAAYVSMTNSAGEATITLEGKPQRKVLSSSANPVPRRAVVAIEVTIKVHNMAQDFTDAINVAFGGPVGGGLSFIADMILRSSFFFQKGKVFQVTDWKEPAWEGEFEINIAAGGSKHQKGEKGGPDSDMAWHMDRNMKGRMHTPEWEEENEQARNYAGYARHELEVSGDSRAFRLNDSSSFKSKDIENRYEAIGPMQIQPPGRNQMEIWSRAEPSGNATLTFSGGIMTLDLKPFFGAMCIVGRFEQSKGRSINKCGPQYLSLLEGLLSEFTLVRPADENTDTVSGTETFTRKGMLPYVPEFDVKVTVKYTLHKNGPPPGAAP